MNRPLQTDQTHGEQVARVVQGCAADVIALERLLCEVAWLLEENRRLKRMLDFTRSLTMYRTEVN